MPPLKLSLKCVESCKVNILVVLEQKDGFPNSL